MPTDKSPPQSAMRLLNWFCHPDLIQEIEGDLVEQFGRRVSSTGVFLGRLWFWTNVLLFFRPYSVRRDLVKRPGLFYTQLWPNFAKSTVRHMRRHKGYSSISVVGLTIGLSCSLVILLFVQDEVGFDRFHQKLDRLYRVDTELTLPDGSPGYFPSVSWPVGRKLRENYAGIETVVHMRQHPPEVFLDGIRSYQQIYYAEEGFFNLFSFPFLSGDPSTALKDPHSVVVTREMEEKFFPGQSALGELLILGDSASYTVTGVLENLPRRSHLDFDMLVSYSTWTSRNPDALEDTHWLDLNMFNYVLLDSESRAVRLGKEIEPLLHDHIGEYLQGVGYQVRLHLQPVSGIYLRSRGGNPFGPVSDINYVYLLGAIGIFVLMIAGVNFVNLGTARSLERAREVGMRKVVGSPRSLLVLQFLGEAVLTCSVAVALAFLLAAIALPYFNDLAQKNLVVSDMGSLSFILGALSIGVGIGVIAGLYPAVVLSGFHPGPVLKGAFATSKRGVFTRRSLVVFQFTISCVLIVATIVVIQQLDYMKKADVGFDRDHVLVVDASKAGITLLNDKSQLLKDRIAQYSGVRSVSATWTVPGRSGWRSIMVLPEGRSSDDGLITEFIPVDPDYIDVMGLEIVAGRAFDAGIPSDFESALLVNEAAVQEMGWVQPENAIGKRIEAPNSNARGQVIGVFRNYNHHGLQEDIRSIVLGVRPFYRYLAVRTETDDVEGVLSHVDGVWKDVFPGLSYEFFFLDSDYDNQYRQEARLSSVFMTFAALAIFISCLGLFGLAAFSTLQRSKEIGIRKVNGASVANIVALLSKEFVVLVGIALVIAVPISFRLLSGWLASFAYRIDIGLEIFVITGVLALSVAMFTVVYQSVKAATANPIETLRYE